MKTSPEFTSIISSCISATHKATKASTTTIIDDQEAHDDNQSHAYKYGTVVKVLSKTKLAHHFKKSTTKAEFVQLVDNRSWKASTARG